MLVFYLITTIKQMTELEKLLAEIEAIEEARSIARAKREWRQVTRQKQVTIVILHDPQTVVPGRPELTPRERLGHLQRVELAQRLFNFVVENGEETRDHIEFHYRFTR